jgi:hypothetical protein
MNDYVGDDMANKSAKPGKADLELLLFVDFQNLSPLLS